MTLYGRIRHGLNLFSVFREGNFIFRYEDMAVTVYKETVRPGQTITQLTFIQPVNSQTDACDFIEAFLKKV